MDWTQTKNVAEANLDTIVGKASNPKVALTALQQKITAEVDKVEAHLTALDGRVNTLPGLLDEADKVVLKVDAIIAKAKAEGRADLAQAAAQKRQKNLAERAVLENELNGIDAAQTEADEWLTKLQDKLIEVQMRLDKMPMGTPGPASTPTPGPAPAPTPTSTPARPSSAAPAPTTKKPGGKADALDDEFAALLSELDVDLAKVELPKKKGVPAKLPDSDDGIPDLVSVADNELPDGEELPPLQPPKGQASAKPAAAQGAKPAAPGAKPPVVAPVKAAAPAPARAGAPATPAAGDAPAKSSKTWLWITSAVVVVGGGGAAVAHFVLHLF